MSSSPTGRLHGLDSARALALTLGVILHATMSFMPSFTDAGWPLVDRSQSLTLGVVFYVVHMFRMTTFFILAGFFGHMLLRRDGVRAFVRDRTRRIVVPLVVGWLILFPLLGVALLWGAHPSWVVPEEVRRMPRPFLAFPLIHLWFLWVLVLFYAITLAIRHWLVERIDRNGRLRTSVERGVCVILQSPLAPGMLAAPLAVALLSTPDWNRWFGIPTPDMSLVPNAAAVVAFGTAFGLGWVLHRHPQPLGSWERRWPWHAAAAIGLTIICLAVAGLAAEDRTVSPNHPLLYVVCYSSAVWAWTFTVMGMALRFGSAPHVLTRYVADASYWVYLVHLPLIVFLQGTVADVPWHWSVKFPMILAIAFALLFSSYHVLVRRTFVGAFLSGRRRQLPGAVETDRFRLGVDQAGVGARGVRREPAAEHEQGSSAAPTAMP